MEIEIRSISRGLQVADFDCGHAALNEWLVRYAHQNQRRNMSRTFVATQPGSDRVLGYYTSLASKLAPLTNSTFRFDTPTMFIARLAVDRAIQGHRIGSSLMVHALTQALAVSSLTGLAAVLVSALNEEAVAFYEKVGFTQLESDPYHLAIRLDEVQKILSKN